MRANAVFPALPWGRLNPHDHREPYLVEAEAWAWRVADTLPDTAQGRRDSEADAECLRRLVASVPAKDSRAFHCLREGLRYCRWSPDSLYGLDWAPGAGDYYDHARLTARAAFRACPGLKG